MSVNLARPLAVAVLALCLPAAALEQLTHRDLTERTCEAAGFPSDFCTVAGTADGNVDGLEWEDMSAHAQAERADALCEGAQKSVARMSALGAELSQRAAELKSSGADRSSTVTALGTALGRALHTVQDGCAHAGMTNVQHAWWSAKDLCEGSSTSPDLVESARECAEAASAQLLVAFRDELKARELLPEALTLEHAYESRLLPTAPALCEYLRSAGSWDGVDHRWRTSVVQPLLLKGLSSGLRGERTPEVACAGLEADRAPAVDVSAGAPVCAKADSVCAAAGKPASGCDASGALPFAALSLLTALRLRRPARTR